MLKFRGKEERSTTFLFWKVLSRTNRWK